MSETPQYVARGIINPLNPSGPCAAFEEMQDEYREAIDWCQELATQVGQGVEAHITSSEYLVRSTPDVPVGVLQLSAKETP